MKKHLIKISLLGSLLLPIVAFAAASDVEIGGSSVITVGGINLTVSGSANFDSISVNEGNFSLVVSRGAGLTITSSDRRTFIVSPTQYQQSFSCTATESTLTVGNNIWDSAITVTVTPESTVCSSGGGGGGGASGGGGGGGGATAAAPAQPTAQPSGVAVSVSPVFNRSLKIGISNSDVKRLQQLLNSDPDTQIAASGAGSPGQETNYFGSATKKAVQKFQVKYGIASSGDEKTTGFGLVGPKTMAKLQEVFSQPAAPTPTAPTVAQPSPVAVSVSPVFTKGLEKGMSGSDVKRLQQLLNSDSDTKIAESGIGSFGNETEYFGSLTEKAVQKFQTKYNIAKSGDSGYGYVGPKTRAKLNEVFGQ
ncbi:MAG: hypothetical protein UU96_C0002G0033 [Parcubacteria group bacterium GW2011_GWC2_42_13]|nr:MAG: hypothetical protein UU96_C0002G0033 [Parcubacteria group bacterium GW2011_GWC2_42_13]